MIAIWQDVRIGARHWRRRRGVAALAIAILALGIGTTTAAFSLLDATILHAVPFPEPSRLVAVWEAAPRNTRNRVSPLNFADWSEESRSFTSLAAVSGGSKTLTGAAGLPEMIAGQAVTTSFFDILGVRAIAGRTFVAGDARNPRVVVISERLWARRFGSDPTIINRDITLDGERVTVIGVMGRFFHFDFDAELWTPFVPKRTPEQRRMHYLLVVGRLRPAVTLGQAQAEMSQIAASIARISPATNKGWGVTVEPLARTLVSNDVRTTALALSAVVGFFLLMAAANVASLTLAQGLGRRREMAVRAAIGGGRLRIARQLAVESTLLALPGGLGGAALAAAIVQLAPRLVPAGTLPPSVTLSVDPEVLAVAAATTCAIAIVGGIAPAWFAASIEPALALGSGGRSVTRSVAARSLLASAQVATAALLITGAGLLLRTVDALNRVDRGFRSAGVLTMRVALPINRYRTQDAALAFYLAAEREIAGIPGVQSASFGGSLPLDGWEIGQGFTVVGDPPIEPSAVPAAHYQIVGSAYFETLGIRLTSGRAFTDRDTATSAPVCLVNEEFVRRFARGRDPLDMSVSVSAMDMSGPRPVVRRVVGVINQVKVESPGEENRVEIYVPIAQNPWFSASLAVKTAGQPLVLAPLVQAGLARIDKDLAATHVRTMDDVSAQSMGPSRFRAGLVVAFAVLSIAVAGAGLFAVLAFSVAERRREFGIRVALGSPPAAVALHVVGGGLRIVLAGAAAGGAAAAALSRLTRALLFGVTPVDPVTLVGVCGTLMAVAAVACAAPALRAASVDPAITLRDE